MDDSGIKLTPALRPVLEFIASGDEHGRMMLQVAASGGCASSQLQALRNAGYVEYHDPPEGGPRPHQNHGCRPQCTHPASVVKLPRQSGGGMPSTRQCRTFVGSIPAMPQAKHCIAGSRR
jgi:hypothetical protein